MKFERLTPGLLREGPRLPLKSMPLSLFNHTSLSHYREGRNATDQFGHTFGGDAASFEIRFVNSEPLHLLYRLNLADPAVALKIPGVTWVPLLYHFSYASYDAELIYRMVNDTDIEVVAPTNAKFDPNFPYADFPGLFPESSVKFDSQAYDPTRAEDALRLAGVFGLERLSKAEMKRAVSIVKKTSRLIDEWELPDFSPEAIVRCAWRAPFAQGVPSKECSNPSCSAEVVDRQEEMEAPMDEELCRLTGESTLKIEARDIRRDSMSVFAIHEPADGERLFWGGSTVQLIFEICECCNCIRVSNQCD